MFSHGIVIRSKNWFVYFVNPFWKLIAMRKKLVPLLVYQKFIATNMVWLEWYLKSWPMLNSAIVWVSSCKKLFVLIYVFVLTAALNNTQNLGHNLYFGRLKENIANSWSMGPMNLFLEESKDAEFTLERSHIKDWIYLLFVDFFTIWTK